MVSGAIEKFTMNITENEKPEVILDPLATMENIAGRVAPKSKHYELTEDSAERALGMADRIIAFMTALKKSCRANVIRIPTQDEVLKDIDDRVQLVVETVKRREAAGEENVLQSPGPDDDLRPFKDQVNQIVKEEEEKIAKGRQSVTADPSALEGKDTHKPNRPRP